jgi:hypothetical protein
MTSRKSARLGLAHWCCHLGEKRASRRSEVRVSERSAIQDNAVPVFKEHSALRAGIFKASGSTDPI